MIVFLCDLSVLCGYIFYPEFDYSYLARNRLSKLDQSDIFEIKNMNNIATLDWDVIYQSLNDKGYAHIPNLISKEECEQLSGLYSESNLYRSVINMQRYRFGKGEYKYFNYPLPLVIQQMREQFYRPLSKIANAWMKQLSIDIIYPEQHQQLIDICKAQQQIRPTPLILRYEAGGYNTLHQDLYGEIYFPFQVVLALTQSGRDFTGGEFVLTEQVPRAQSKAEVLIPNQGDAIIFTTNFRSVNGTKGYYRANMKHGISEVRSGVRYALGIIFHDAS